MYSLRRVLAVRFSLTMLVALTLIAFWATFGVGRALRAIGDSASPQVAQANTGLDFATSLKPLEDAKKELLLAMIGTVILGTLAVAMGAYWLAGSAVRPVIEVATQAEGISPGTLQKRITAHADVLEYQSLIEVLNGLLERNERAFETQHRLLDDVGHELRTPLTVLRGEFEIALRSERTPRDYQLTLRSGLEEIDRMTTMCDELLLITRANSNTLALHPTRTDLNDLIKDLVDHVRRPAEKKISVSTRLAEGHLPVWADSELLSKMLEELVDNAVKFSAVGGVVTVGTEQAGSIARLWVEDSGPGISEGQLPHLFEPFYRADESRTRSEGTGLGLCMAAGIARTHGGTIRARNLAGGGARFEVDLPLHAEESSGRGVRAA